MLNVFHINNQLVSISMTFSLRYFGVRLAQIRYFSIFLMMKEFYGSNSKYIVGGGGVVGGGGIFWWYERIAVTVRL